MRRLYGQHLFRLWKSCERVKRKKAGGNDMVLLDRSRPYLVEQDEDK